MAVIDPTPWADDAACVGLPTQWWYPEAGDVRESVGYARIICGSCPVRQECLHTALSTPPGEDYGVWGGTTRQERKKIRQQREEEEV